MRLIPTGYDFPDEFVGPIIGNSLDLVPNRIRQEVLSEVNGWLIAFLEVWLQPTRLQSVDWMHVSAKMGLSIVSGKAAEKAVRHKVMGILDRPYLLSLRRLNDKDMEIFLLAIADLLFGDTTVYTDIDECRAAIAQDANDFNLQVDELRDLSLVQLQDVFVVSGGFDGPQIWGSAMPRLVLDCIL